MPRADSPYLLRQPTGKLGRPAPRRHLTKGNSKVGDDIYVFNLPAGLGATCPGASTVCSAHCYAQRGRWRFENVHTSLERNWQAAGDPFFAEQVIREVRRRRIGVVRLHSSGDFSEAGYVRKWARIIANLPGVTFYAYTRSWRLPGLRAVIEGHLVPLPNLRLWYSADADTGMPTDLPAGVRVAWLQEREDEPVPPGVDLVFRTYRLRRQPAKRVGLSLICPVENGSTGQRTDCGRCGVCWK
jgi:hypothetical protein